MSTVHILIPGVYFDGYRVAARPDDVPDALHALLMDAETTGEGTRRRAALDVPEELLPALAKIAYDHFSEWGDEHIRYKSTMPPEEAQALAHRARAAFAIYNQARPDGVRVRPVGSPEGTSGEDGA